MASIKTSRVKYDREHSKKVRKLVKRDKFRKIDKYFRVNDLSPDLTLDKRNKMTGLHLSAKYGNCDSLDAFLKLGADCRLQDTKGNFPLHYSLKFCLKSRRTNAALISDLVSVLLGESDPILNTPNEKGTTCKTLLKALNDRQKLTETRMVEGSSSDDTDASVDSWQERLRSNAEDDYADSFGRDLELDRRGDSYENYDVWADRIYAEYRRRRRPKTPPPKKKNTVRDSVEYGPKRPKLVLKPEALRPEKKRDSKYKKFLAFIRELDSDDELKLSLKVMPFDAESSSDSIVEAIMENSDENELKAKVREALRFWHPDKFEQKFGHRLEPSDKDSILKIVTHVSQSLIRYGK